MYVYVHTIPNTYSPMLAVSTCLLLQSRMRSLKLSALNPANTTLCTAPMRAQASTV